MLDPSLITNLTQQGIKLYYFMLVIVICLTIVTHVPLTTAASLLGGRKGDVNANQDQGNEINQGNNSAPEE